MASKLNQIIILTMLISSYGFSYSFILFFGNSSKDSKLAASKTCWVFPHSFYLEIYKCTNHLPFLQIMTMSQQTVSFFILFLNYNNLIGTKNSYDKNNKKRHSTSVGEPWLGQINISIL